MGKKLSALKSQLESLKANQTLERSKLSEQIYALLSAQWDDWRALQKALVDCESATMYGCNEYGIYAWFRFAGLSDVDEEERGDFERYVSEKTCFNIDWANDCFERQEGDDCYIVQDDDWRRDSGVFQSGKLVLDSCEYKTEEERNKLIEEHMEREGCFPGVFLVDRHGNVTFINTKAETTK